MMIRSLHQVYSEKMARGSLQWAALCVDVRVADEEAYPEGTDAIQVDYEDRNGQSARFFVPYDERPDGTNEYHQPFTRDKARRWFA